MLSIRIKSLVIVVMLLVCFQVHAQGQALTLEGVISQVDDADKTPFIDAAFTTLSHTCVLRESGAEIPRFHAASISKLFTAIVIIQLRDEGALSLNDLVGLYEPAFSNSSIRISHLLTHTSGLRDLRRANGRTTDEEVSSYINSLGAQRSRQAPGLEWRYADAGFNLLGRVIENILEQPFERVMKERLLIPMGMLNSDFDLIQIPENNRVQSFNKRGRAQSHPWDLAFLPSSGLQTTASDLAIFVQGILKIVTLESEAILRFESLQEMTIERIDTEWDGVIQGYGWQLVNIPESPQWRHAGGESGFESLLTIYPDNGFGIAVLGNKEDWPRFQFEREIRGSLLNSQDDCSDN